MNAEELRIVVWVLFGLCVIFGGISLALFAKHHDLHERFNALDRRVGLLSTDVELNEIQIDKVRKKTGEFGNLLKDHLNKPVKASNEDYPASARFWFNTRIITRDQFYLDHSTRGNYTLRYYENTDKLEIICDEQTDKRLTILDPRAVVGNYALKHFGECSGDPDKVYVRNLSFNVDFEIVRVTGR